MKTMVDKNQKYVCDALRATHREGIEDLINYMETSGFFLAPCSTQFHLASPGGLAEHSLNVMVIAHGLRDKLYPDLSMDSIVLCSLLHDLGKCGQFGKPEYTENLLKSGKVSESKPYEKNKELLPVDHEVRSVAIASQFIKLTEEEQHAILLHNGLYGTFKYSLQGNETPLQMILHFADLWASRVVEH